MGTVSVLHDDKSYGAGCCKALHNDMNAFNILKCKLKILKLIKFMSCIFYHNKNCGEKCRGG